MCIFESIHDEKLNEMVDTSHFPTWEDIQVAEERIRPYIHCTPVLTSQRLNSMFGIDFFFKCENFQKVGAFKARGAINAIFSMDSELIAKGVATHSSGNHAQAVALGAQQRGVPAYIVMPSNAPEVKRAAVLGYGAEVISCEPTLAARESTLEAVVERTGAQFIHPYNDWRVIAGQATAAKELLEEVQGLEALCTPVGGGGLLSGTALTAQYMAPHVEVYAGEPAGADDAARSFQSGRLIPSEHPKTVADGLLTSLGDKTFAVIRSFVSDIITVEEEEIISAMRLIWERMKIIIEPSCAVPLAAMIQQRDKFAGKQVGIILSGGNVDLGKLPF